MSKLKTIRTISKKFLALLLACICVLPVWAEGDESDLHIKSADDFLSFIEDCRLDSYSQGMTVSLDCDLDFEHRDMDGVPIFCGVFQGNGHEISGVNVNSDGSDQGLFRYLSKTGEIYDLAVRGQVAPGGSHRRVGGIVGNNSGTIRNCSFNGSVSGSDRIGGIAGINGVSGVIESCSVVGALRADHFAGGIAGENSGLIRSCKNEMQINTTAQENNVELSDITIQNLLGTEAAGTVTDVGGIAGTSTGVIRDCENSGKVGYAHIGYNVGGIAGSQRGYIAGCRNTGVISGRKEVGGIVGQMEPVSRVEYSADTLQILQRQLTGTSVLASRASANVMNSAADLSAQFSEMERQSKNAQDAVTQLFPSKDNPHIPDRDSIQAAHNTLVSSIDAMEDGMRSIASSSQDALRTSGQDIEAIADQLSDMSGTISSASENMGASIADVSDEDTPDDLTGKVEDCHNSGEVSGDLNAGGIAGAVSRENDMDPEDDLQFIGDRSLNFSGEVRSVIRGCTNAAAVSGKKRNIGGIVGQMSLGLTINCLNTGHVDGARATYIGGIAGTSIGFIRGCSSKCEMAGSAYVGGIAGSASVATDCRAMIRIEGGKEYTGAILGCAEECENDSPVCRNVYLPAPADPGAIDGVSYQGIANPLEPDAFFASDSLDPEFTRSVVSFQMEDGTSKVFEIFPGDDFPAESIPPLPVRDGYAADWEDANKEELTAIYFDRTFHARYTPCSTTVSSREKRENGRPILMMDGTFSQEKDFSLVPSDEKVYTPQGSTFLECWQVPRLDNSVVTELRICPPEDVKLSHVTIRVLHKDGTWSDAETAAVGSYLVFPIGNSDTAFCLLDTPDTYLWVLYILMISAVIGGAIYTVVNWRRIMHPKNKKDTGKLKEKSADVKE